MPILINAILPEGNPVENEMLYWEALAKIGGPRANEFFKDYAKSNRYPGSAIALTNVDENEINEQFINTVLSNGKNIESGLLLSKVEKPELKLILFKHLSNSRDIMRTNACGYKCYTVK